MPLPLQVPPAGVATRVTIVSVKHTRGGALVNVIFAAGFTVMLKLCDVPVQLTPSLVNVGVTVIVPVIGVVNGLAAVKLAIFPVPLAGKPIAGLLLIQLYTVPATAPVKVTAAVDAPRHSVWLATAFTVGVGFTVIVKLCGVPVQVAAVGVTVIVAVCTVVPVLVAVKLGILPVPPAASPMLVLLLVQL